MNELPPATLNPIKDRWEIRRLHAWYFWLQKFWWPMMGRLVCPWRGHSLNGCDTGYLITADGEPAPFCDAWCVRCKKLTPLPTNEVYNL